MNNCYATFKKVLDCSISFSSVIPRPPYSILLENGELLRPSKGLFFRVWFTIWIIHHNSLHKFVPILYLMIFKIIKLKQTIVFECICHKENIHQSLF